MGFRSLDYSRKVEELLRTEVWFDGPGEEAQPIASIQTRDEWARTCRGITLKTRTLRLKYERAARLPWLSVKPDPPEPEATP